MDNCELSFSSDSLGLDPQDIARMMGYISEVPDEIVELIDVELANLDGVPGIQGGYQIFDAKFDMAGFKMLVEEKEFRVGRSVWKFLKNADKVAMFVCTAGEIISSRAKQLMEQGDVLEGYVADVIGSEIVEKTKDKLHKHLNESLVKKGLKSTNSYCPGYCTWNVSEQSILFSFLPEDFCKVSLSESCMMMPVKSLSGVVGIGKNVEFQKHACSSCSSVNCIYRNTKHLKNL